MLGPLFYKELLEVSRRPRYYVARALVGLAVLVGIWLGAAQHFNLLTSTSLAIESRNARTTRTFSPGSRSGPTISQFALMGQSVFYKWAVTVSLGLWAIVPALTCGLIAGEKEARTLETLLTTNLEDREILVGKLASRLLLIFVLIVSGLPAIMIASLYGGFNLALVASSTAVHVTSSVFIAALGLYYSTVTRKPYVAAIRTYALLAVVWYVIPYGIPFLLQRYVGAGLGGAFRLLSPLSMIDLGLRVDSAARSATGAGLAGDLLRLIPLAIFIAVYLLLASWLFRRCVVRLRRVSFAERDPALLRLVRFVFRKLVEAATGVVESRSDAFGWRRLWQWELRSRSWGRLDQWFGEPRNPLELRNWTANVYDPERYVAALQVAAWVGWFGLLYYSVWIDRTWLNSSQFAWFLLHAEAVALLLLTVPMGASAFARERQHGSWEVLLLTELTPRECVAATTRGVMFTLWPTFGMIALTALLFGFTMLQLGAMALWLAGVLLCQRLFILISMTVSLSSRRIAEATALAMVTILVLALAPSVLVRSFGYAALTLAVAAFWVLAIALAASGRRRGFLWLLTLLTPITVGMLGDSLMARYGGQYGAWAIVGAVGAFSIALLWGIFLLGRRAGSSIQYVVWLLAALAACVTVALTLPRMQLRLSQSAPYYFVFEYWPRIAGVDRFVYQNQWMFLLVVFVSSALMDWTLMQNFDRIAGRIEGDGDGRADHVSSGVIHGFSGARRRSASEASNVAGRSSTSTRL